MDAHLLNNAHTSVVHICVCSYMYFFICYIHDSLSDFCLQILVHGSFDATASLADYARTTKDVVQGNVYTPSLHELIDATTESHIYQVLAGSQKIDQFYLM